MIVILMRNCVGEIALKLTMLAEVFIKRYNMGTVCIGEIMPRQTTRKLNVRKYNVLKRTLNKLLRNEIAKRSGYYQLIQMRYIDIYI